MTPPNYNSPAALRAFLDERGLAMRKRAGQNFLIDGRARSSLLDALAPEPGRRVWEIGAGLGSMTGGLLERGALVTAFEIDKGFCACLREFFAGNENFTLVEGDVLKTWKKERAALGAEAGLYLFGNLPYNIAASLLGDFIEAGFLFDKCVVTVQREVARRLLAGPGSKDYASISILREWVYEAASVGIFKGSSFYPAPKVDSQALRLERRPWRELPEGFAPLVRSLFSRRRKTVRNNLPLVGALRSRTAAERERLLEEAAISGDARPADLGPEDFARLARLCLCKGKSPGKGTKERVRNMSVSDNARRVEDEIREICLKCGRDAAGVRLMAVSKFHSREAVDEARKAGLTLFGENRVQEAEEKFAGAGAREGLELHLIGSLQRNKARNAAALFDMVQSVDRPEILAALGRSVASRPKQLEILLEMHTGEESKHGYPDEEALCRAVEEALAFPTLTLRGLMTMAPFTDDSRAVRRSFRLLRECRDRLAARFPEADLSCLSMGMSGDFRIAIEEGSTLLRIGTAIFGERGGTA